MEFKQKSGEEVIRIPLHIFYLFPSLFCNPVMK